MPTAAIQPLFAFGGLVFSNNVDALTRRGLLDPMPYVRRHICGDWGDLHEEHQHRNNTALAQGGYVLSSYAVSDDLTLCIFTEASRSHTTVFLHDELRMAINAPRQSATTGGVSKSAPDWARKRMLH